MARQPQKIKRQIGPHSRVSAIQNLDGRTRSAKRLKGIERDLSGFAAAGSGVVSVGQAYLARRLAVG